MTTILVFAFVGIVVIAGLGVLGRRKPAADLTEWTVGGRQFGSLSMLFLQAGEIFTTFTFLGVAGLAYGGGVAALYAVPYVPLGTIVLFFAVRRLWSMGRERGYLTQGDFIEDRHGSRALARLVSVIGVVALLPYLQLQITGLGLIVKLVTGNSASGTLSMIVGTVLVVVFVLWAGLRGVATSSYFKDGIMLVVLVVLMIAIPTHFAGGISSMFHRVGEISPQSLTIHAGPNDHVWFITSMFASAIGVAFLCLPHAWPAILSARGPRIMRRNYTFLPLYEICIIFPMIVGFASILVLKKGSDPNGALLSLSKDVLPSWATGLVVVAAIATAMVPSAGILIGISGLVARNVARVRSERGQLLANHSTVVVACGLALVLGIYRADLLANLLLLTFSGSAQLAPANILGFLKRRVTGPWPIAAGIVVGEVIVIVLTFPKTFGVHLGIGTWNVGLIGLAANLIVLGIGIVMERAMGRAPSPDRGERAAKADLVTA